MSKITNEFVEIVRPLLGADKFDTHVLKFYLSILKKSFDEGHGIKLDESKDIRLQNLYYDNPSGDMDGINEREWGSFKKTLLDYHTTLVSGKDDLNKNKVLDLIKNAYNYVSKFKNLFIISLIKSHLTSINAGSTAIINTYTDWNTATVFVFLNDATLKKVINIDNNNTAFTGFSFKLSKFVAKKLLEDHVKTTNKIDTFWTKTNDVDNDNYYREVGNIEKLYTTDKNGNKIDVSLTNGTDALNEINNDRCMGSKVKQHGTFTCADYLTECLSNGDPTNITNCKKFMMDSDFWEITSDEVKKMNPIMITKFLDKFGFKIIVNNKLKEYESLASWSKRLHEQNPSNLDDDEYKSITTNTKLTGYLNMLIRKINSNPAILNKNYNNKFNLNTYAEHFKGWSLIDVINPVPVYKVQFNAPNILRQSHNLRNDLSSLRQSINQNITFDFINGKVLLGGIPFTIGLGALHGGSIMQIQSIPDDIPLKESYPTLKGMFFSLENALKNSGKFFDEDTKKQIEDNLENFKQVEEKLIKSIKYTDKYVDLINIHKKYDPEDVLTMDHLETFIKLRENYFDKTKDKLDLLMSAVETLTLKVEESNKTK